MLMEFDKLEAKNAVQRGDVDVSDVIDENWETLKTIFPRNWQAIGRECGSIKRLREFKTPEILMRILLLHLAKGYSLRETAAISKEAGLASVSDVAILKRLRSCGEWFRELALALLKINEIELSPPRFEPRYNVRLVDGTVVREPGKTGSEWVIHYSINVPSLNCDFFELTPKKGKGNGEKLSRIPVDKGDLVIADRGYCTAAGIRTMVDAGAEVIVRHVPKNLPLVNIDGSPIELLKRLKPLKRAGDIGSWNVKLIDKEPGVAVRARVCAIRKTTEATLLAQKKLRQNASRARQKLQKDTLEYAKYVMIIVTASGDSISSDQALELYRIRWQVELIFKRFKSLAQLGHVPKHDDSSVKAWLFGKLFIALLSQRLIRVAESISPWGFVGLRVRNQKSMA